MVLMLRVFKWTIRDATSLTRTVPVLSAERDLPWREGNIQCLAPNVTCLESRKGGLTSETLFACEKGRFAKLVNAFRNQ